MKLFLTSSGLSDTNEKSFLDLLNKSPKGLRVAFVPTAMNRESEEVKQKYMPSDIADLEDLGMKVDLIDLEKLDEEVIVSKFKPFDIIYVYGGNTFYLMHYANKSGFTKHIEEIIKNKIYVGVSAGSVIAGSNIELAQWGKDGDRNIIGLKNMNGLKLVKFGIIPHWKGQFFEEVISYPFEVRYIKDGEAIIINEI